MQLRTEHIYREFLRLTRRLSNSQIMMMLAVVVGILAGLGTYLFEILLHGIKSGLIRWFPVDSAHVLFLIYPAIGIILATLFVKYIVRDNISEGVTRVLYAMSSRNSRIPGHNCWTSIVGGATTIGFGGSVGPEAPIVLTGAAIGSNVGRLARLNYKHTTLLLCCGAGAALAAIFKAPITGVVFVLEILMLDITAGSVIPLLIASITATTMAFMLRGFDPILAVTLQPQDAFELWQIPLFILLGVCCGLMSWYFTSTNLRVGNFFRKIDSQYKKWLVGGAVLGILIFIDDYFNSFEIHKYYINKYEQPYYAVRISKLVEDDTGKVKRKYTYLAYFAKPEMAYTYLAEYNSGAVVPEHMKYSDSPTFAEMYEKWKKYRKSLKNKISDSHGEIMRLLFIISVNCMTANLFPSGQMICSNA